VGASRYFIRRTFELVTILQGASQRRGRTRDKQAAHSVVAPLCRCEDPGCVATLRRARPHTTPLPHTTPHTATRGPLPGIHSATRFFLTAAPPTTSFWQNVRGKGSPPMPPSPAASQDLNWLDRFTIRAAAGFRTSPHYGCHSLILRHWRMVSIPSHLWLLGRLLLVL